MPLRSRTRLVYVDKDGESSDYHPTAAGDVFRRKIPEQLKDVINEAATELEEEDWEDVVKKFGSLMKYVVRRNKPDMPDVPPSPDPSPRPQPSPDREHKSRPPRAPLEVKILTTEDPGDVNRDEEGDRHIASHSHHLNDHALMIWTGHPIFDQYERILIEDDRVVTLDPDQGSRRSMIRAHTLKVMSLEMKVWIATVLQNKRRLGKEIAGGALDTRSLTPRLLPSVSMVDSVRDSLLRQKIKA